MEFLETYKRLDNLCKDLFHSSAGISSYITEMEQCYYDTRYIKNWESDYKKLKHYRYIRNQIVHENWASENSLCNMDDIHWLNEFYERILNQTDSFSQYYKLVHNVKQQNKNISTKKQAREGKTAQKQVVDSTSHQEKEHRSSLLTRFFSKVSHLFGDSKKRHGKFIFVF